MLDKAAAALDAKGQELVKMVHIPWEDRTEEQKEGVRVMARVVVHALLNPDEKTLKAGASYFENENLYDNDDAKGVWNNMINEILKR